MASSLLIAAALAVAPPPTTAEDFGQAASHHIEWQTTSRAGQPMIAGYVYNRSEMRIERVRLRIEPTGQSGASTWSFVSGTIPPGGRGYFEARLPSGAGSYRVSVQSFDWARCGDG